MSRNQNNTKKPHCKVCQDAGKPESVYSSHWVKSLPDRNGKTNIICPTLLDTECRYCFKLGHTTKFCPVLEQNNKKREKNERRIQVEFNNEKVVKTALKNKPSCFTVLDLGSDSEEENEQEIQVSLKQEYPSIIKGEVATKPIELTGWAAIAAKPKTEKQTVFGCPIETKIAPPKKIERQTNDVMFEQQVKEVAKVAPWVKKDVVVKKCWADYSDSESEDETW